MSTPRADLGRVIVAASFGFTLGVMLGPAEHVVGTSIAAVALLLLGVGAVKHERGFTPILFGVACLLGGLVVAAARLPAPETISAQPGRVGAAVWIEGVVAEAPELGLDADALVVDVTATATLARTATRSSDRAALGAEPRALTPSTGRVRIRVPH
ncbi:hypothetical protein L6R52_16330, partial [Myxococcota bacterium]|nr:hypothetical protein [Myxococcota bacterium]